MPFREVYPDYESDLKIMTQVRVRTSTTTTFSWFDLMFGLYVGVVSATVNILCELARRNPRDYLPLAPQLFDLLTTSSNNWMLIKLIKLVGTNYSSLILA